MWFPPKKIPLEDGASKLLPVLVVTAAYSRFMFARMIPTRRTGHYKGYFGKSSQLPGVGAAFSRMCTPQAEPIPITWAKPTRAPSI